jgi:hypothetical protein
MSNIIKDILKENISPQTNCKVREIADLLPKEDKDAFMDAINDETIAAPAIERALKKNGFAVASTTIRRHRRGDCSCGKLI